MPSVVVALFYLWLIAGTAVFIYRRVKGIPMREPRASNDTVTPVAGSVRPVSPEMAGAGIADRTPSPSPVLGTPVGPTVASLVAGITMPCDLVPYIGDIVNDRPAADRVVFTTSTFPLDAVRTRLGEELERLGFDVDPARDDDLLARSSDDEQLAVHIAAPPSTGVHERYPDAPAGAVVVELTTG